MQRAIYPLHPRVQQTGATLIIALLVLVVILLTGLAAMNNSGSQFQLAANAQFETQALNNAEIAVATAEDWVSKDNNRNDQGFAARSSATAHLYPQGYIDSITNDVSYRIKMNWSDSNSKQVNADDETQRYMIELLSRNNRLSTSNQGPTGRDSTACTKVNLYRITTRGEGGRSASKLVQSIYSVKNC
jgi:Tfp pilus assembly protein PilX